MNTSKALLQPQKATVRINSMYKNSQQERPFLYAFEH